MGVRRSRRPSHRDMSRREFLRLTGAGIAGASLLGACADVQAGFTGAETVPEGTLIFTHGPDDSGTVSKVIDKFNKENGKGITVEYREMPADSGQYFDKLRTDFQAGGGDIDVMSIDVIWPPQFGANGWIEDLSDWFTDDEWKDFLPATVEANTLSGKIYGVPWFTDAGMFYYRKDLLEKSNFSEPPKTWDEMQEMADKVTTDQKIAFGFICQGAEYEGGAVNGLEYIWNAGGDVLDPNDPNRVIIAEGSSAEGLEIYRSHVESGVAPEAVSTYKELESMTAFILGDAVFMRNWPFVYGTILGGKATGSEIKPEQTGVAAIPVAKEGDESFSCLGGWNFAVNKVSDKKEEAKEFIKYMAAEPIEEEFAINASLLPPRAALYEDKKLIKEQPVIALAKEVTQNAKPRPQHPFYSDMSLNLAEQFNLVLKGDAEPQEAIDTLQDELQRLADIGKEAFDL